MRSERNDGLTERDEQKAAAMWIVSSMLLLSMLCTIVVVRAESAPGRVITQDFVGTAPSASSIEAVVPTF